MLSTTAQYALRALSVLASLEPDAVLGGKELAERTDIPQNYLSKILVTLGSAGIIDASRGTGGGYRMGKPPSEVPLGAVVGLFDRNFGKPACVLGLDRICSDKTACPAHSSWRETKECIEGFLDGTTVAAITPATGRKPRA